MAFEDEAMSTVEVGLLSPCHLRFNKISKDELRKCVLDFVEEMRCDLQVKLTFDQ